VPHPNLNPILLLYERYESEILWEGEFAYHIPDRKGYDKWCFMMQEHHQHQASQHESKR
jgi:hypothetical protein